MASDVKSVESKLEEPEIQPITKPVLQTKSKRRSSALSLKNVHKKREEKQQNEHLQDVSKLPKQAFSEADFFVYWKKYIQILEKQGDKMLASILNATQPQLTDTEVHLVLPNQMMLEEVRKNQVHVLNYLRNKLQNYLLNFRLELDETQEKAFVYTPQEKYAKLREINPLLDHLRKSLHLDL